MELDLLPNLKIWIAGFLFSPQSGGESDPYSIENYAFGQNQLQAIRKCRIDRQGMMFKERRFLISHRELCQNIRNSFVLCEWHD